MKKSFIYTLLVSFMALSLVACDKDNDNTTGTVVYGSSTSSALVTRFALKPNTKILAHLDSVHFTIDQVNKVIYNADSLPKGTDITKLLTTVTFGSTVGKTQYVVSGGTVIKDDKTIDYTDTSTDSIDFTGMVTLNVTSQDGSTQMSYRVKVNVHQTEPDSLYFPMGARRDLPAAGDENYAVGMAKLNATFYSMVNNSNGRYVATALTPAGKWNTSKCDLAFTPVEKSLTATSDALYILDTDGNLYMSQDAQSWTSTGIVWQTILGAYGEQVLGVIKVDGNLCNDEYPRRSGFAPAVLPKGFPVSGQSQLVVTSSNWALNPMALMVGGRDAQGNLTNSSWGYDGKIWAEISRSYSNDIPAVEGATLYSYFTYNLNAATQHASSKATWIVMGGKLADGKFNRKTYISRDLGITWHESSSAMLIPDYMPSFSGALAYVCTETTSAKRIARPITEWDVPYVYIVGGIDAQNRLLNNVWKGTIIRMTYKPVY